MKAKPLCVVNKKDCCICSMENFTPERLKVCRAKGKKCYGSDKIGNFGNGAGRIQNSRTRKKAAVGELGRLRIRQ